MSTGASATAAPPAVDVDLVRWLRTDVMTDGAGIVSAGLTAARELSARDLRPGGGRTGDYLSTLITLGFVEATLARVVEPHLDAVAILHEAGIGTTISEIGADPRSAWGVYAAGAPGMQLRAERVPGGWTLSGTKPWCSLADRLSHAVITAAVSDTEQRAFAIRLDPERVSAAPGTWVSRGLAEITSGAITLQAVPAVPVGEAGWYLSRPGFAWGGIGVGAVWHGIALALRERMRDAAGGREPDQIADMHLGAADRDLFAAGVCLAHAAAEIDAGRGVGQAGEVLALRVRSVIARAAENVMTAVGHALGPGPLTTEEEHARRVADLSVYVRQHHAERDLARLGKALRDHNG
jgi:alkylation response protein AidB-like acyl-CoA dehydrogenase